jgi:hypothetical protein
MTPTARRLGITAVCLGALLAGGGVALALGASGTSPPATVPLTDVGRVPAGAAPGTPGASTPQPHAPKASDRNRGRAALPRDARLRIGAGTAPIGRVGVVDHEMQIPRDPRRVGWWRASAAPGSASGSVVIVGHVNYAGVTGVLAALPRLRPGDPVTISAAHRRVRYVVTGVRSYPKSTGLPAQVFARGGRPRLVLITCGGQFDSASGNYEDNVIAYAVPGS